MAVWKISCPGRHLTHRPFDGGFRINQNKSTVMLDIRSGATRSVWTTHEMIRWLQRRCPGEVTRIPPLANTARSKSRQLSLGGFPGTRSRMGSDGHRCGNGLYNAITMLVRKPKRPAVSGRPFRREGGLTMELGSAVSAAWRWPIPHATVATDPLLKEAEQRTMQYSGAVSRA